MHTSPTSTCTYIVHLQTLKCVTLCFLSCKIQLPVTWHRVRLHCMSLNGFSESTDDQQFSSVISLPVLYSYEAEFNQKLQHEEKQYFAVASRFLSCQFDIHLYHSDTTLQYLLRIWIFYFKLTTQVFDNFSYYIINFPY